MATHWHSTTWANINLDMLKYVAIGDPGKRGSVTLRMSSWGLCISDQQDETISTPVDIDLCSENLMAHERKFNAVAQLGLQMIE